MEMTKYEEGQIGKHEFETIKKIGNKETNQYIVEYYYAVMTPQGVWKFLLLLSYIYIYMYFQESRCTSYFYGVYGYYSNSILQGIT